MTSTGVLAGDSPKFIAHRGASADAPENTLAAFRLAWQQGADGIEGDFYQTVDGAVVCIHDPTTKRTAGKDVSVKTSTLAELRALDVGAWKGKGFQGEQIPTLAEVLDVLPPDKWFFLEIKDTKGIVPAIATILEEKKANPEKVVLISFSGDVVKECREKIPGYGTCLISELKNIDQDPNVYLKNLEACGATGLLFRENANVTEEWLRTVKARHGLLMAWTVDDVECARRVTRLGAEFIGTNRPGALRTEFGKHD
jgi:glycerophosphoryl diester phosphodiesterase